MNMDLIVNLGPTNTLRAELAIFLGPIRIPYELPLHQQDACQSIRGASCPLNGDEEINYAIAMEAYAPIFGNCLYTN